jgi:CBS domain-containing protein
MRVRDVMTPNVIACQQGTDLGRAARLMLDAKCGTLPVIDKDGRLAGIITDRDIALALATRPQHTSQVAVHEAMSQQVRYCFADDTIAAALKQMEEARVRRLPVVARQGSLAGIVSIDDIVVRALDRPGGISSAAFINALTSICSRPAADPGITVSRQSVSG